MGVLNVTPDSFYDRGKFAVRDAALRRAHEIVDAGAAILDVGGQSYAATNGRVAEEEELRRIAPVLEALRDEHLPVAISVDTYRAPIAHAALERGADLINDCSGLSDPMLPQTVARYDAALVIMHLKGRLNVREPEIYRYGDPLAEIVAFLRERVDVALAGGIRHDAIVVDPGLEFGKEPETDREILRRFDELARLDLPILLAASRKTFIARSVDLPTEALLEPSLAAAALGWFGGARIFRVHDVAETVRFLRMLDACAPHCGRE